MHLSSSNRWPKRGDSGDASVCAAGDGGDAVLLGDGAPRGHDPGGLPVAAPLLLHRRTRGHHTLPQGEHIHLQYTGELRDGCRVQSRPKVRVLLEREQSFFNSVFFLTANI